MRRSSVLFGLGLFLLGLMVVSPTSHSSGSAPVTVINTPLPVQGTVNLGNSPMVNAAQSGAWNVGISGTPTVAIGSFSGNVPVANPLDGSGNAVPLVTKDSENPGRHYFSVVNTNNCTFVSGLCKTVVYKVPPNEVAVVESVSGGCTVPTPGPLLGVDLTELDTTETSFVSGLQVPITAGGVQGDDFGQNIKGYFPSASGGGDGKIIAEAAANTTSDGGGCQFFLQGYLVSQ